MTYSIFSMAITGPMSCTRFFININSLPFASWIRVRWWLFELVHLFVIPNDFVESLIVIRIITHFHERLNLISDGKFFNISLVYLNFFSRWLILIYSRGAHWWHWLDRLVRVPVIGGPPGSWRLTSHGSCRLLHLHATRHHLLLHHHVLLGIRINHHHRLLNHHHWLLNHHDLLSHLLVRSFVSWIRSYFFLGVGTAHFIVFILFSKVIIITSIP